MIRNTPDTPRLEAEHLDEIRASVDWQALFVGLGLRKSEAKSKPRDWWAFSPFHDEKTPSFHMSEGGLWYDFSIGEGGGAIELVQRLHGGTCYDAGRFILERGWAQARHDAPPVRDTRDRVRQGVTRAVTERDSAETPENAPIRQDLIQLCTYHEALEARGISQETCDLLRIGYLPQGRSMLKDRIVFQVADARPCAHGRSAERTASAGARPTGRGASMAQSAASPASETTEDMVRQRVILSHLGRAVGDGAPKYLFYQGFHKSAELYGQELIWLDPDAGRHIRDTGVILVTEGPFDVAKAVEAGFRNVVGAFGASLSDAQIRKLQAMLDHHGGGALRLAFDRDKAGQDGTAKALERCKAAGVPAETFDWEAPIGRKGNQPVHLPISVQDLCDFTPEQLTWLRARGLL